jgi:GT2 family glycosyltransferase
MLHKLFGRPTRRDPAELDTAKVNYFSLSRQQRENFDRRIKLLSDHPRISVIMPAYKTKKHLIVAALKSIYYQAYTPFEIIVVDDSGPGSKLKSSIPAEVLQSDRFRFIDRGANVGISEATNAGVQSASGDFVVFIDHDDEMTPDALLVLAENIAADPQMDVWYSDQVTADGHGSVIHHFLKPDWSPVYLLGCMYLGHLLAVRRDLCEALPFLKEFDGVQDYEFMLRVTDVTHKIGHIPAVLYKWRAVEGSLALGSEEKSNISALHARAVNEAIGRKGFSWLAYEHDFLPHRVVLKPSLRTSEPSVSIIIPSKNQGEIVARCLDSLFALTDYDRYEVIVVDNRTTDPLALKTFEKYPVKHLVYDEKTFNYSEANNRGVQLASGDFVLFLNNDTEIISSDWLRELVMFFEDPEIGAVGPTLLYPDRTVQHAGVVLGMRGTADHIMRGFGEHVDGYAGSLSVSREVSAVTAACLMMRRSLFAEVGGFSEDFAKHYQDVDLCCKVREAGKRIISVASTKLIHHESLTRKGDGYDLGDRAILIDRWKSTIDKGDPYHNGGFMLDGPSYTPRPGLF